MCLKNSDTKINAFLGYSGLKASFGNNFDSLPGVQRGPLHHHPRGGPAAAPGTAWNIYIFKIEQSVNFTCLFFSSKLF